MILDSLDIDRDAFEAGTGWTLKPEGACQGDVCIPLSKPAGDPVDVRQVANDIGMPLVDASEHGLWALGPAVDRFACAGHRRSAGAHAARSRRQEFKLSSLRGQKVLLFAWAPY